jgi:uncharacterized protein (TIGR03435 family)
MTARGALTIAVLLGTAPQAAQKPEPSEPQFEVVSIKPNRSGDPGLRFAVQPGGRSAWTNTTLSTLIDLGYQRSAFDRRETLDAPDWIYKDRFDVIMVAPAGAALNDVNGFPGPLFAMMRAMLADRFQLRAHNEVRERPVYALVMARADKRLGARMKRVAGDCTEEMKRMVAGGPMPPGGPPCAFGGGPGPGRLIGNTVTAAMIANALAPQVGRPVIDRTGLSQSFNIDLEWVPDIVARGANGAPIPGTPAGGDGASIFTALQEQLGLKLESTRAPVDVLVIDRAERPSEN